MNQLTSGGSRYTEETLAVLRKSLTEGRPEQVIAKAWSQSNSAVTGITAYDLQGPAKLLYPVLTPLRDSLPRVVGGMGIQANWRAVTAINSTNVQVGVAEGNRGQVQNHTTKDYIAAFKALGLEDSVSFEADLAARGFDDVKALAVLQLLEALMIGEERVILWGNTSQALGTPTTPTLADVATGGSLVFNTQYSVRVVALTAAGYQAASVAGGLPTSGNVTLPDGTVAAMANGTSIRSAAVTITTANDAVSTHKVRASTPVIPGAAAYAWFWGASGSEVLGAITTINSVEITATATGTQAHTTFTVDYSVNPLVFDGLITQSLVSGSGAYVKNMATGVAGTGTTLTADTVGGIVEIEDALRWFWDNYRLSPTEMWVSSQEQKNITTKIYTAGAAPVHRFNFTLDSQGNMNGGSAVITGYRNKYGMNGSQVIDIKVHPDMPPGTIFFRTTRLPYKLSNVTEVQRMYLRRDYYQLEWPLRTRKYEYGVYMDGVLQNFFPPSTGVIYNIANG